MNLGERQRALQQHRGVAKGLREANCLAQTLFSPLELMEFFVRRAQIKKNCASDREILRGTRYGQRRIKMRQRQLQIAHHARDGSQIRVRPQLQTLVARGQSQFKRLFCCPQLPRGELRRTERAVRLRDQLGLRDPLRDAKRLERVLYGIISIARAHQRDANYRETASNRLESRFQAAAALSP